MTIGPAKAPTGARIAPLLLLLVCSAPPVGAQDCIGDCNDDGEVRLDELIRGVNLALGLPSVSPCDAFDDDGNGTVAIDELVRGVGAALGSCSALPTPTPTSESTATRTATTTPTNTPSASPTFTPTPTFAGIGLLVPVGGELQVNVATVSEEECPAVAMSAAGGFVIGWRRGELLPGNFVRTYDSEGQALGGEGDLGDIGSEPVIVFGAGGDFLLVWDGGQVDPPEFGTFGRFLAPSGEFRARAFEITDSGDPFDSASALAAAPDGSFVLAAVGPDGAGEGVFGFRLDAEGERIGSEFQINTATLADQTEPAIAAAEAGLLVVWARRSIGAGDLGDIFARRVASDGTRIGEEFRVNSFTRRRQDQPAIAALTGGSFVVLWESESQDGTNEGVFGQRLDSAGSPLGPEFQANTYVRADQGDVAVAADRNGGFLVVWESEKGRQPRGQDGSEGGVFAQRFDGAGAAIGTEFQVNSHTIEDQGTPQVAGNGSGDFVVVWESTDQDGIGEGVFGQRLRVVPE